jgi:predicted GIY-YIG superfamily endonuclease
MKQYYYKDATGQTKRYLYCCRYCPEPYTQEQLDIDIFEIGDNMHICKKCKLLLGMNKKPEEFRFKYKVEKEEPLVRAISEQIAADIIPEILKEEIEEDMSSSTPKEQIIKDQPRLAQNKFCAYVVKCNDETLYFGITSNIKNAVKNHNSGNGSAYTKTRRPVVLVTYKEAGDMEQAKQLKTQLQKEYK